MNLDILFSGCPRWNIVKPNTFSTLCIHGKEKGNALSQIYASLFVCVEVLQPSQPNGVMSSAVSLPNHTFTGQA